MVGPRPARDELVQVLTEPKSQIDLRPALPAALLSVRLGNAMDVVLRPLVDGRDDWVGHVQGFANRRGSSRRLDLPDVASSLYTRPLAWWRTSESYAPRV
jgi:hypothetical protein